MLGHRTTALLASRLISTQTAREVRLALAPESLLSASTWADWYAHTPEGSFSKPWHWIDALDSPPSACSLSLSRDCPAKEGCIVSAITNHTARALDPVLDQKDRRESLKWVVHFIGDVHQPLHTENMLRGGNGIEVLWDGRTESLHRVWDSLISEKIVGGKGVRDAVRWVDQLAADLEKGRWDTKGWGCETWGEEECVVDWAVESNKLMCGVVLGMDYVDGGMRDVELSGEYYEGVKDIVEQRVAMAGWRMAKWLETMFEGAAPDVEEEL